MTGGFIGNSGLVDHGDAKRKLVEALMMRQAQQAPRAPAPNMQSVLGGMVGQQPEAPARPAMNFDDVLGSMIGLPEYGAMKRKKG